MRLTGDWESWLRFFFSGVEETASEATRTARALMSLAADDEKRIQALGRRAGSALRIHRLLQARPLISIAAAVKELKLTAPTVTAALSDLQALDLVHEITGGRYARLFTYHRYLQILNQGTEPITLTHSP